MLKLPEDVDESLLGNVRVLQGKIKTLLKINILNLSGSAKASVYPPNQSSPLMTFW